MRTAYSEEVKAHMGDRSRKFRRSGLAEIGRYCEVPPQVVANWMAKRSGESEVQELLREAMECSDLAVGVPGYKEPVHQDSHGWIGLAFVLAAYLHHHHGWSVLGYRASLAGSAAEVEEYKHDGWADFLERADWIHPDKVEVACEVAYRYGKMLEALKR